MPTTKDRADEAREYLVGLGVTVEKFTAYRFAGRRVFELDIETLGLNVEHLRTIAYRSGLRSVPTTMVQTWVDMAAETAEADERVGLAEEIESKFGFQADIRHTADIAPSKVDAFTDYFNSRLREAWVARGVPADVPDNYFDRCIESGLTPEQCAVYWRDVIPLELI
jgi:hypothetical protein